MSERERAVISQEQNTKARRFVQNIAERIPTLGRKTERYLKLQVLQHVLGIIKNPDYDSSVPGEQTKEHLTFLEYGGSEFSAWLSYTDRGEYSLEVEDLYPEADGTERCFRATYENRKGKTFYTEGDYMTRYYWNTEGFVTEKPFTLKDRIVFLRQILNSRAIDQPVNIQRRLT